MALDDHRSESFRACHAAPAIWINSYAAGADHGASPYVQGYVSARIHHVLLTGMHAAPLQHALLDG
jgi:hypothetical protein